MASVYSMMHSTRHVSGKAKRAVGVNWRAGFDFEIKVIARIPG